MKIFTLFSLSLLFLSQCRQEETECQPKNYHCEIFLCNPQGEALVGDGLTYSPDSVAMFILNQNWEVRIENNKIIWNYAGLDRFNQVPYFLRLSGADTDTLRFYICRKQSECFDIFCIDSLKYNNTLLLADTSYFQERLTYQIVKN